MARPTYISKESTSRTKSRSSSSPQRAMRSSKTNPKSPERVTKPPQKPSKAKQAKEHGYRLELVKADGTIIESVAVPNIRISLQDLLKCPVCFKNPETTKEVAPREDRTLPEPHGIKRGHAAFCYRLGLLQAFAHAPPFCAALRASTTQCAHRSQRTKCLACALNRVMQSYQRAPAGLDAAVSSFHEVLRSTTSPSPWAYRGVHEHADIQEFFLWLGGAVREQHGQASALGATLELVLEARWTCAGCGRVHAKQDSDVCLSLGITAPRRGLPLRSYLREYMAEEVEVRCECGSNEVRQRRKRFTALPSVLVVQLKRFEYVRGRGMRRVDGKVQFPELLSLKEFAGEEPKETEFELTSYVAHSGTLAHGHYVAMVKGSQGIYEINDHLVKKRKGWYDVPMGFAPYLLFYVRK